jgi:hypothetical protein
MGVNFHFEIDLGTLILPSTNGFKVGSLIAVMLHIPLVESVMAVR